MTKIKQRRVLFSEIIAVAKATLGEFIKDPKIEEYFAINYLKDFDIFQEILNEGRITIEIQQHFGLTNETFRQTFKKMERRIRYDKENSDDPERAERFWSDMRATGGDMYLCFLPGVSYETAHKLSKTYFSTIRELLEYLKEGGKLSKVRHLGRACVKEVEAAVAALNPEEYA